MTFRDYIRVLRERAAVIVACTVLVAIGAFAASNLAPSSFTARAENDLAHRAERQHRRSVPDIRVP